MDHQKPDNIRSKPLSLKLVLVVPFVLQIFLAVGLTGFFSWRNGQQAVKDLAQQLREETTLFIKDKLDEFLGTPPTINLLNQDALLLEYISEQDIAGLHRHFYTQGREFEKVESIFWGGADGEFIGSGHFNQGSYQYMVAGESTGGIIQFFSTDDEGNPQDLVSSGPPFDPRELTWYQAAVTAGESTWGSIFTYRAFPLMAIPAVTPIYDDQGELLGVLGNNFFLSQISDFLNTLRVSQTGQAYIIERSGDIVASSTLPQPFIVENGVPRRLNVFNSSDPLLQSSAQEIIDQFQEFELIQSTLQLDFTFEESRHFLQVTPFRDELGLDWLIVVVMPESTFMAQIHDGTRQSILLCVLALAVATLSALLTSRWIVTAVQQLIEASQRIASGNFKQTLHPNRIKELSDLSASFNQMTDHLHHSFEDLNQSNQALKIALGDLQKSEEKFRRFAENSNSVLWIFDFKKKAIIYLSPAFEQVWGLKRENSSINFLEFLQSIHPGDQQRFLTELQTAAQCSSYSLDYRIVHPQGSIRWIRDRIFQLPDESQTLHWLAGIAEDITERKQVEQALVDSESKYRLLAENMSDLVGLHHLDGTYFYISSSVQFLLGYNPQELLGVNHFSLIHPDDRELSQQNLREGLDGTEVHLSYRIRKKTGVYCWVETIARAIVDGSGGMNQFQMTSRDITEKVRMQKQLEHDAFHDSLTGLPNRNFLIQQLSVAIRRLHAKENYQCALLFLDLDRFKTINDSLGHIAGDEVLIDVAHRLLSTVKATDIVARLGGDEFIVLLENISGLHDAFRVAEQILEQLKVPFIWREQPMVIGGSLGIVRGTIHYSEPTEMIRDADIAMYRAKAKGRSRYELFDPAMYTQAYNRLRLENDLRHAVDNNELFLCYQPILACETGLLKGFEALMRWNHPDKGLISPAEFIPIAEETQLIIPMGLWALKEVATQLRAWQNLCTELDCQAESEETPNGDGTLDDDPTVVVSLNVSAVQLKSDTFLADVDAVLAETGVSGHQLVFEITESILIEDMKEIVSILTHLRERNISVSIDDFGTGYSSLSYLCDLPINTLKIDKSFVSQILIKGGRNYRVVETILTLTKQLGLNSVAEGIETVEQWEYLKQLGCNDGQGYLFSKPERAEAVAHWLLEPPSLPTMPKTSDR